MNGKKLGGANANNDKHSPAKKYIDAFYAADKDNFHVRISIHNFTVTDLKPDTEYRFTARSVFKNGKESGDSNTVVQATTAMPKVFNITDYGAKPEKGKTNTREIQAAIDACSKGDKVLIPPGVFTTGALFLKSDMTLEISEGATLLGSADPAKYPLDRGYYLYPYSRYRRPPSLINVMADGKNHPGDFQNVRIVGKGTIDGNGWKKTEKASVTDELGNPLPLYIASTNARVQNDGILAWAQVEPALKEGIELLFAYSQRRSSLITMRAVRNVYYEGFTALNPAFHGIMNLECENVVFNGLTHTTYDANNADGVELGNSKGAMVFNNFFDTGDDAMNFAAGTGEEARKQPPQTDTWVFNNYFREGHGAVVAGSHTGAWIEKILAEDNVINGTDRGLRSKSTTYIGGGGRDILFRDTAMKAVAKEPFIFTLSYSDENVRPDYPPAKTSAVFRDITVRNVSVEKTRGKNPSIEVQGVPDKGIFHERLIFENVTFRDVNPAHIDGLKDSVFRNVVFESINGGAKPWKLGDNENLKFEGSTQN
ncbi:MAG: glycoside hydrolase family 28 protein, partial [Gammaproteobacteria bacterium]|nr:glycoside hydrolase family 28 protein [Gammaproteobacteria bacterium]